MNPVSRNRTRAKTAVMTLVLAVVILGLGGTEGYAHGPDYVPSAYERVCEARDRGQVGLRESVLLRAQLLFRPTDVPVGHPFAPRAGEVPAFERCTTGFYLDVHRVRSELTNADRAYLASLDQDLQLILESGTNKKDGPQNGPNGATQGLPSMPDLDQTETGTYCIVHYTLTQESPDKVPNKDYAKKVRKYIDLAVKKMACGHFNKALAEGTVDFKGKMHVYIHNLVPINKDLDGKFVFGTTVSGTKTAGFIKMHSKLDEKYGSNWKSELKGTRFHEYFHGIQASYAVSDEWFIEGMAVWAECYYGKNWGCLNRYYNWPTSVFNTPDNVLWLTTSRKYSTSALAFHLSGALGGWKFFRLYLENSENETDAIKLLKTTIAAKGSTWEEQYRKYLVGLYLKKLGTVDKKYLPDVKLAATHNSYGVDPKSASVSLTGADFYLMKPQKGAKPATFIATFETSVSDPRSFLVKDKKSTPVVFTSDRAYVKGFGKSVKKVVLIVTDTTYATKDMSLRAYKYSAVVPWVKLNKIKAESPIVAGSSSKIDIAYDLLGVYKSQTFPVDIKVVEKGPDVVDLVSGTYERGYGKNQKDTLYFHAASTSKGTYKFAFEYRVPATSWSIPQVKSKKKCSVKVKKSSSFTGGKGATGTLEFGQSN